MRLALFFWLVYALFLGSEWWGYAINYPDRPVLYPLTLTALAACVLVRLVHFMNQSCEIWQSDIAMHIFTHKNLVWLFSEWTTVILGICMVAGSLWQRKKSKENQKKGETK